MITLEDGCAGLEQEFFLVDEDGVLSNRADEFLARCQEAALASGRDPGGFAQECSRSMVEINTPPVHSPAELSREYLTSLELALDAGRELGLRLYPLATYPLHMEPVMRGDLQCLELVREACNELEEQVTSLRRVCGATEAAKTGADGD